MRETRRSRAVAPGSRTFSVTSQAVARSNSTLGRSVPVQHRGIQPAGQAEADERVGELAVAVALPDLGGVEPAHPAGVVRARQPGLAMASCPARLAATPPGTAVALHEIPGFAALSRFDCT